MKFIQDMRRKTRSKKRWLFGLLTFSCCIYYCGTSFTTGFHVYKEYAGEMDLQRSNKYSPPPQYSKDIRKKKERAKISKTGAWIISEQYEYLLDYDLANRLVTFFRNSSVIEFGAGTGRYTSYLKNEGINIRGYDGVENISELSKGLVQSLDLTKPVELEPSEWVLCLEVAEHIPRRYEKIFVENIQKTSKVGVVLSWAGLSQPGVGHVNNREQGYVKKVMSRGGLQYVEKSSNLLRESSKLWWFKKNIMVFIRQN